MNRRYTLFGVILLAIIGIALGYQTLFGGRAQEVTFEQLSSHPTRYSGKQIVIEGFIFHGWEVVVLCERLEPSGYAAGHLTPGGSMIWIEGGIPQDVYEALYKQEMMGPEERFGKIRVLGLYENGGEYGHLGGYSSQIVPTEVDMLQWSP
jgi:hypothetical protein